MKRKLTILIALVSILVFMVPVIASAATVQMAGSGGSLHLRKGPGTNYGTNGYVKDGETITVLTQGSVWSEVRKTNGVSGYIKNLYISGIGGNYADGTTYYSSKSTGYVKTASSANLRAGASTSTSVITALGNGVKVTILGYNGDWYLVSTSGGTQGYISKNLVTKSSSSSSSSTTRTSAVVTASVLNMRAGAGTNYKIVTALSKGTKVSVLSTSNSRWWKVKYSSYTGYMSRNFLK